MKYIAPTIKVELAQAAQMMAESLAISNKTVTGGDALTKEDNAWDIWDEDEE